MDDPKNYSHKKYLRDSLRALLKPYRGTLSAAWYLALAGAVLVVVQSALLAELAAAWLNGAPVLPQLRQWLPWLVLCWLARPCLGYLKERLLLRASVRVRTDLRARLLAALANLGPARRHFGSDGALSGRILDQVDAIDGYVSRYAVQQKLAAAMPLLVAAAAAYYSPFAAALMLCTAPLVPVFMILMGEAAARKNRAQMNALAQLSGRFLDLLRGLPTLRRLGAVEQAQKSVDAAAQDYRKRTMKVLALAFLSTAVLEFFAVLSIALVALYLGLGLLGALPWAQGRVPVPYQPALFILLLAPEFYAPLRQLGSDYHDKAKAEAAVEALMPILQAGGYTGGGTEQWPLAEPPQLVFDRVRIDGDGGRVRLPETSFSVAAGEKLLIAGESGSGKSSLLQALLGFAPYAGEIAVNGHSLRQWDLAYWRGRVGYLAQTPPLLPGSIADNLRLPKPDADDAELVEVLRQVELWDLVSKLPEGLNTLLGERGQGLSGGQLQRLALAQMLLRDAVLWLLDEPTAHLDAQSAEEIHRLLARLSVGKTVLLVSHDTQHTAWTDRAMMLKPFQGAEA